MNNEIKIFNILNILNYKISPKLISYEQNKLYMSYVGENLYNQFYLPSDWKTQINNIFDIFTENNIYYPEFNIKNITVKDNIIYFIDYGLCEIRNKSNENNKIIFIEILEILENKFLHIIDNNKRNLLYNTLMFNLKLNDKYKYNIF